MADKTNMAIECTAMILKMNKHVLKFLLSNDLCMGFLEKRV